MATIERVESLKQHLTENSAIKTVYFNKAGDWQFHKREKRGYTIAVPAAEVMAEDYTPAGVKEAATTVSKPSYKELLKQIDEAESEDEVNDLVGDSETRSTVKTAAANKIAALKKADADLLK